MRQISHPHEYIPSNDTQLSISTRKRRSPHSIVDHSRNNPSTIDISWKSSSLHDTNVDQNLDQHHHVLNSIFAHNTHLFLDLIFLTFQDLRFKHRSFYCYFLPHVSSSHFTFVICYTFNHCQSLTFCTYNTLITSPRSYI